MSKKWYKDKIVYYSDELNDDFNELDGVKKRPSLKENYRYLHKNIFSRGLDFFLYYIIAKPILGGYCFFHGIKYKNKKNIRHLRKKGAFLYGNHVSISDAFKFQSQIIKFKKVNIIGYSDAASIPLAKTLVKGLGYLPIPNDGENLKRFKDAIEYLAVNRHQYILIYPEAHIWPYYTKIRDFKNVSFRYPAETGLPVVPVVTVWRKVFYSKKPRQTVIFGTPIYPIKEKTVTENRDYLRDECYKQMKSIASSYPQYEFIKYEYRAKEER